MTLFQAWADSLTLLRPKNFKLFMLVTLKSIVETYKLLLRYWWWLYVLIGIVTYGIESGSFIKIFLHLAPHYSFNYIYALLIFFQSFFLYVMMFVTYLTVQPSVSQKNFVYFYSYVVHILYLFMSLLGSLVFLASLLFSFSVHVKWPWSSFLLRSLFLLSQIFMPFFFFDSSPGIKNLIHSAFNSIKMFVFNIPLVLLALVLCVGFTLFVRSFCFPFGYFIPANICGLVIIIVLFPAILCLFANIYIKKLHDQFDLYFPQPQER